MIFALHGNIGSPSDFDFLKGDFLVSPVDLWSMAHTSLVEAADQINEAAKPHKTRGMVGYSMGGRIALQAIANAPDDYWDFAVILSAHPGLKTEAERTNRLNNDITWAQFIRSGDWFSFLDKWNSQSVLTGRTPPAQKALEKEKPKIAAAFENWSLGNQADLRSAIARTTCPIAWLVGDLDHKFKSLGEELALQNPNINLTIVPNCGHRLLLECPAVIKHKIKETMGHF